MHGKFFPIQTNANLFRNCLELHFVFSTFECMMDLPAGLVPNKLQQSQSNKIDNCLICKWGAHHVAQSKNCHRKIRKRLKLQIYFLTFELFVTYLKKNCQSFSRQKLKCQSDICSFLTIHVKLAAVMFNLRDDFAYFDCLPEIILCSKFAVPRAVNYVPSNESR